MSDLDLPEPVRIVRRPEVTTESRVDRCEEELLNLETAIKNLQKRMLEMEDNHESMRAEIRRLQTIVEKMCSQLRLTESQITGSIEALRQVSDERNKNYIEKLNQLSTATNNLASSVNALIKVRENEKNIEQYKRGLLQNIKTAIYFVSVLAACVGAIYTFIHWVEQPKSEIVGK